MRSSSVISVLLFVAVLGLAIIFAGTPAGVSAHTDHHEAAAEEAAGVSPRRVIVDTDMGLDDIRAVFALLADSTIHIDAFVTVGGSAAPGKGADNLAGLLETCGSASIPVIRGSEAAGAQPPPWRNTANTVGGKPFPPPREISVMSLDPTDLTDFLMHAEEEHIGGIHAGEIRARGLDYLALGPLTNLALLVAGDDHGGDGSGGGDGAGRPAGVDGPSPIRSVWIPAEVEDLRLSDWNLLYDAKASKSVFDHADEIVIMDISGAGPIDGPGFLASLDGASCATDWIEAMLNRPGKSGGHVFLYDDLAVAAFLRDDLGKSDKTAYRLGEDDDEGFRLIPDAGGNTRMIKLADTEGALATLEALWASGPRNRHSHDHTSTIPLVDLLRTFHGHLGPYVVIGYRMGQLALRELGSDGHFGVSAEVHSPLKTPRSCLIDGIQLGSGCTLGKGNISVEEAPEPAWAVFRSDRGRAVTIRLRPEIPVLVADLVNRNGVEAAGREFLEMPLDSLYDIK
jgi:hypothetical protein